MKLRVVLAVFTTISICTPLPAHPQIALDGTIGPSGALSGPNYRITEDMGRARGSNLFHSFDRFNINAGEQATFTGSSGYANVISRVTGKLSGGPTPSQIDGVLKSDVPNANFWLVNPAGVHFGPNARVNVPAALHVSTADHLRLADGSLYSAVDPEGSTLTTAPPEAFGFLGGRTPGAITFNQSTIELKENNSLSLVGGDITLMGSELEAPSGHVYFVSVASGPGEVRLSEGNADTSSISSFRDIKLLAGSNLGGSSSGGSHIFVRGHSLVMSGLIEADGVPMEDAGMGAGNSTSVDASGLAIDIGLTGVLDMTDANIGASAFGDGNAGDIHIAAKSIIMDDRDAIAKPNTAYFTNIGSRVWGGAGDAGDVVLEAETITIQNGAFINTAVLQNGTGSAGNISVQARTIDILNGSDLFSVSESSGTGGDIFLSADSILLDGKGRFTFVGSQVQGTGSGGSFNLRAGDLTMRDGAQIGTGTFDSGRGGDIDISSSRIDISQKAGSTVTGIFATVEELAAGNGGNMTVAAEKLILTNRGRMGTFTIANSSGSAGDINLKVGELHLSDQAFIASATGFQSRSGAEGGATGASGQLHISADKVDLKRGSFLSAESNGSGPANDVVIEATEVSVRDGSTILASAFGSGDGGDVIITTGEVIVAGAGRIFRDLQPSTVGSQTTGIGKAGDVRITTGSLQLFDSGSIKTDTFGEGDAGNIIVDSAAVVIAGEDGLLRESLTERGLPLNFVRARSGIFASSNKSVARLSPASGNAGNIELSAGRLELGPQSVISSLSETLGRGGEIDIAAETVELSGGALITAQSLTSGDAGRIIISAPKRLTLHGGSITTEALKADGGQIDIQVDELIHMEGSQITTTVAGGAGDAGNIFINPTFLVMENSRIEAKALGGQGGNIDIIADFIIRDPASIIDATSAAGPRLSGTVTLSGPEADLAGTIAVPTPDFLDASSLLAETCPGRSGQPRSGLVQGGRGGLPADPSRPLHASVIADKLPETSMRSSGEPRSEDALVWRAPAMDLAATTCIERGF